MKIECIFACRCLLLLTIFTSFALADECLKREDHTRVTFLLIDKTDKNVNLDQLTQSFDALQEKIAAGERFVARGSLC